MSISSLAAIPPRSALLFVAIGTLVGWNTIAGIRSGSVAVRGGIFSRRKNRSSFWLSVSLGFAFSAAALLLGLFNLARVLAAK